MIYCYPPPYAVASLIECVKAPQCFRKPCVLARRSCVWLPLLFSDHCIDSPAGLPDSQSARPAGSRSLTPVFPWIPALIPSGGLSRFILSVSRTAKNRLPLHGCRYTAAYCNFTAIRTAFTSLLRKYVLYIRRCRTTPKRERNPHKIRVSGQKEKHLSTRDRCL